MYSHVWNLRSFISTHFSRVKTIFMKTINRIQNCSNLFSLSDNVVSLVVNRKKSQKNFCPCCFLVKLSCLEKLASKLALFLLRFSLMGYVYSYSTVVILINATTLMHKSTLSTNNFGNNRFGQKYQKQSILRVFRKL